MQVSHQPTSRAECVSPSRFDTRERTLRLALSWLIFAAFSSCEAEAERTSESREPTAIGTAVVSIGETDGPDEYVFGRISGVAARPFGQIFVADGQASVIRAYGWNGQFLYTVARRGSGPGEVERPCCLAIDPDGLLWVRDNGNRRYSAYSNDSVSLYVRSIRMVHSNFRAVAPSFADDSILIDVGSSRSDDGESILTRFFLNVAGEEVERQQIPSPPQDSVPSHTITREVEGGVVRMVFQQPLGPRHLVAHAPDGGYAVAVSSTYQIRWVGPRDTFDTVVTASLIGPPVTADERDSVEAATMEQLRSSDLTRSDFPLGVPDRKPVLQHLQFDSRGRLWVYLTPDRTGPNLARVHDLEKATVMVVSWPRDVDLRGGYLGDGVALGTSLDELGVGRVVRVTFSPDMGL